MSQNNAAPPSVGHNTQANDHVSANSDSSIATPGQVNTLHKVPVTSSAGGSPRKELQQQAPRKKRLSFGGGNDGRGSPMFASLESAHVKRMADGYQDMKPPDGFIGAAFKRLIGVKSAPAAAEPGR